MVDMREIRPNPGAQTRFLQSTERQVLFGGAYGGGKSFGLAIDPVGDFSSRSFKGIMIRRHYRELRDLIQYGLDIYPKVVPGAIYRKSDNLWEFPNGGSLIYQHAEDENAWQNIHGLQFTWMGIDEAGLFPDPNVLDTMFLRLRKSVDDDPNIKCALRMTANPGNPGSWWLKERFVDPAPPNTPFVVKSEYTDLRDGKRKIAKISRRFIPATVFDNPKVDPNYVAGLANLPDSLRKQRLYGDWEASASQAFPEIEDGVHIIDDFPLPSTWHRFRCADLGYAEPFATLWIAVDNDRNLVVYRELTVIPKNDRIGYMDVAKRILDIEGNEYIRFAVIDSQANSRSAGYTTSPLEDMNALGLMWQPVSKIGSSGSRDFRQQCVQKIHDLLRKDPTTGQPRLRFFRSCRDTIASLKSLQIDPDNIEDVVGGNDHHFDALKYGVMFRANPGNRRAGYSPTQTRPKAANEIFGW